MIEWWCWSSDGATAMTALALGDCILFDTWKSHVTARPDFAYSILIAPSGGVIGVAGVYLLAVTPNPPMASSNRLARE